MIQGVFPCYFDGSFNNGGGLIEAQSMRSLHFSLMVLKEKITQVESFLNIFVAKEMNNNNINNNNNNINYDAQQQQLVVSVDELTTAMAFSSMANLIQEILQTASVMMLSCEQISLGFTTTTTTLAITNENNIGLISSHVEGVAEKGGNNQEDDELPILEGNSIYNWFINNNMNHYDDHNNSGGEDELPILGAATTAATTSSTTTATTIDGGRTNEGGHEVVELDVADLLARYTHYCQVCGRGFKREANLRMHMKAHGDKYKSSTLRMNHSNKITNKKMSINNGEKSAPKRYSCPHKGCRWNKNHVKFQPLKSIVCVKNHYKRSHCPKMFVCKRCNTKEFSVLSDLKTHEKHCGEIKWYCSCGTSFYNKDKLMDHVALFVGHMPLSTSFS